MGMSNVLTIAGQKGGTGKSVTAVNLSTSLAVFEKNTLLIDCDPQGCSSRWCGIRSLKYLCDIASVLSGKSRFVDAILKTDCPYLDVMPAGFDLFQAALKLGRNPGNEKILRLFLKDVEHEYEYIIIDAPSSYNFLSMTAMTAADWLIACMTVQHNSSQDVHLLLQMVKYIRAEHRIPLKIAGFLFNRCETIKEIESYLEGQDLVDIKQMVYQTCIPDDAGIKRSVDLKIPVVLHDIKSPAAKAYLNFAREVHFFFN